MSYRKIARLTGISKSRVQRICLEELERLPKNNQFTFNHCNQFSKIFEFDAKYINILGFEKKQAFLWGVDYVYHDFPIILLAHSESYRAWATFFEYFRILNHYPEYLVCDDNSPLKIAARHKFPKVKIQTCTNHFSEKVRRHLRVRSNDKYKEFSKGIDHLLSVKRSTKDFNKVLFTLFEKYKKDPVALQIIVELGKRRKEFLAFQGIRGAPTTTNMIESFNSHLESRLKSLHHFYSFRHAKLWLNAYVLKRRYTEFVSCKGKFKHLNGKTPLQQTKKPDVDLPPLF